MNDAVSTGRRFEKLVEVMAALRGPGGCPWDREQTHQTLTRYLLEETHEAIEAIEAGDHAEMAEELGDVLLQVVFHAQMAREAGTFDIDVIIDAITNKLIERHPHVFGEGAKLHRAEEVLQVWEAAKLAKSKKRDSMTDGLPDALPALQHAYRLQQKVAQVGFEWDHIGQVFDKVREELGELEQAHAQEDMEHVQEEMGDLLFALVNLARYVKVEPETALRGTIRKFKRRFRHVETRVRQGGRSLQEASLEEMDGYWEEAKRQE